MLFSALACPVARHPIILSCRFSFPKSFSNLLEVFFPLLQPSLEFQVSPFRSNNTAAGYSHSPPRYPITNTRFLRCGIACGNPSTRTYRASSTLHAQEYPIYEIFCKNNLKSFPSFVLRTPGTFSHTNHLGRIVSRSLQ